MMKIKNASVFTENGFVIKDIDIEEERITEGDPNGQRADATAADGEILDAAGLIAVPGLVDIHFHGAMGKDFCDASEESIQAIADYEASQGVLAICPATMTFTEEILTAVMEAAAKHENGHGADLIGINMEGPYISPGKVGAQNPLYVMKADGEMFERLQEKSGGLIKLVDVAPEEAGNLEFIEKYADRVRISVAHTCTDYDTAKEAYRRGAKHLTHMFNAMPGISHRSPGPILAALEEGATPELIADGIHIHPSIIRMSFQLFGADRMILISDSLESTGLPDGDYMLGGQKITVCGKKAVLTEKPDTIAGSSSSLYQCVKYAVREAGIPLADAIRAASINPARAIGVDADYGSLEPGHYASLLLLDEKLEIRCIIHRGRVLKAFE